ncbi:DUF4145 domain-containing protein [Thalassococcus sp. BH17M4-6]|uniref:DUF4145 domain-containing protein n=1 Tax=Thalassococcus sp. BH17M4-6 TaxID=3413148 RepID=UPI003BC7FFD0
MTRKITVTTTDDHPSPFFKQLRNIDECPRCGIKNPLITLRTDPQTTWTAHSSGRKLLWAWYACESCAGPLSVQARQERPRASSWHLLIEPPPWVPFDSLPEEAKRYLKQARQTLSSPDASILMSSSAIDAMLKARGLSEGTLFQRIEAAVIDGLITKEMSEWGHKVRLDANSIRHADTKDLPPTTEDANMVFTFADRLGEILFHIPSLVPKNLSSHE